MISQTDGAEETPYLQGADGSEDVKDGLVTSAQNPYVL